MATKDKRFAIALLSEGKGRSLFCLRGKGDRTFVRGGEEAIALDDKVKERSLTYTLRPRKTRAAKSMASITVVQK